MTPIENDIFYWEDLQEATLDCLMFEDCTFKKDFGPWKKGEQVPIICINFDKSTFAVQSVDGKQERVINIGLIALGEDSGTTET